VPSPVIADRNWHKRSIVAGFIEFSLPEARVILHPSRYTTPLPNSLMDRTILALPRPERHALAKSQEAKWPVNFRAIQKESPTLTSGLFKDPGPFTTRQTLANGLR
jgi:hypothetical protein